MSTSAMHVRLPSVSSLNKSTRVFSLSFVASIVDACLRIVHLQKKASDASISVSQPYSATGLQTSYPSASVANGKFSSTVMTPPDTAERPIALSTRSPATTASSIEPAVAVL